MSSPLLRLRPSAIVSSFLPEGRRFTPYSFWEGAVSIHCPLPAATIFGIAITQDFLEKTILK
jgi:hypothetical protein